MSAAPGSWITGDSQQFQTGVKQNAETPEIYGNYYSLHTAQIYLEN